MGVILLVAAPVFLAFAVGVKAARLLFPPVSLGDNFASFSCEPQAFYLTVEEASEWVVVASSSSSILPCRTSLVFSSFPSSSVRMTLSNFPHPPLLSPSQNEKATITHGKILSVLHTRTHTWTQRRTYLNSCRKTESCLA